MRFLRAIFVSVLGFFIFTTSLQAKPAVVAKAAGPAAAKEQSTTKSVPATTTSAAPPKNGIEAGYDGGFFIQSPDKKYKLKIGGYGQFHYEFERSLGENTSTFRVRRARLAFSGNLFSKDFTYKVQIDLAKFQSELLLDYWFDYKILGEDLQIRVGQQTMPWIRQHIHSSTAQQFVDRSLAASEFANTIGVDTDKDGVADKTTRNGRDVGVVLHGKHFDEKLEYQAGISNGAGTNALDGNERFWYGARTVYNITGQAGYEEGDYKRLENPAAYFGVAGNYNVKEVSNDKIVQLGSEAGIKFKGISAQGEFMFRDTNPKAAGEADRKDYGYYGQVGYFVVPQKFEVAVRASQLFLAGLQNDKAELQLGLNGFIYGDKLKLQSDYSVLPTNTQNGVETAHRYRLRLQTKF